MAFEQFFYTGDVNLTIGANADCSCKLQLDDGNTAFIDNDNIFRILTEITEFPEGGVIHGGSGEPHMRFTPIISGGIIAGGHAFSTEERPAGGGILVGGNAIFFEKDEEIGSGGILVGGENFWSDAQAGILVGGQAIPQITFAPSGGSINGGTATIDVVYAIAVAGGALIHGDAHNIENITVGDGAVLAGGRNEAAETAHIGVLAGGRAITSYDEVGIGGAIAGGIAPNGTHDFGEGGVLIHGSVIQRITQYIDGSGLLAGGKSAEEPPISGGVFFGGGIFQTFNEASLGGGLVANGRAHVEITPVIAVEGPLAGGVAVAGIQPGIFGGALFGGGLFQTFDESGLGGAVVDGHGIDTQSAYHFTSDGDFVQVTQPDPNIYKITIKHYNYEATGGVTIVGNAVIGRRFFGQSIPTFAFGKTPVKNEACRSFREIIRQPTVLSMTRTKTREWLEELDPADWSITSFDPNKREVCILVEAGFGITHLITVELLLIDSGVGSP